MTKCVSEYKKENLCEACKRNINIWEIGSGTEVAIWETKEVKNLKTKTTKFICDGFIGVENASN